MAFSVPALDPAVQPTNPQASPSGPGIPPLTFTVPEAFHALPLGDTTEERAEAAEAFVRELFPNGDDDLWSPAAPVFASIGHMMGVSGLAYSAIGIFAIEEGIAHCTLSVAAVQSDHTSTEVAAHGIRAILANDPAHDARWIDLPCGPAVSCITVRELVFSPQITKSGAEEKLLSGQIQVHVPFPTGPYTAVFTLETTALHHFGEFCDMAAGVLRTVNFPDPDEGMAAA